MAETLFLFDVFRNATAVYGATPHAILSEFCMGEHCTYSSIGYVGVSFVWGTLVCTPGGKDLFFSM